jgi:hypothetical protein
MEFEYERIFRLESELPGNIQYPMTPLNKLSTIRKFIHTRTLFSVHTWTLLYIQVCVHGHNNLHGSKGRCTAVEAVVASQPKPSLMWGWVRALPGTALSKQNKTETIESDKEVCTGSIAF